MKHSLDEEKIFHLMKQAYDWAEERKDVTTKEFVQELTRWLGEFEEEQ